MYQQIFMRYPDGKSKAVTFSYDDGVREDKRLAELFAKYGLKATFNFNGVKARDFNYSDEEIQNYFYKNGHEIAVHGYAHRANGNIRPIEGIADVLNCRLDLEKRCGKIIRGMAYPDTGITQFGPFISYEQVKNYLKELDIAYARTLAGDNNGFEIPEDFYAWLPTAHHNNENLLQWIDEFLDIDISTKVYHSKRRSRLMYIWGHSYEFTRDDNWEKMETICAKLAGNEQIWYATNIEICDYVNAFKSLRYSADGTMVYNPTVTTLWFDVMGKIYCIKAGETLIIE